MISFIIPAYNEEALIGACVRSIVREAHDVKHEIIVVDNRSTDGTAYYARDAGAKVIFEPKRGTNAARQAGYLASQGDLIALIDADSEMPHGWLVAALRGMRDLGVVVVSGPPVFKNLSKWASFAVAVYYVISGLFIKFGFPMTQGGNCMIRRSALDAIGGFNPEFTFYGDDADTAARLDKIGRTKLQPDMWIWQSSRRMEQDGWLYSAFRYFMNYIWVLTTGRPWTKTSDDVRAK